MFPNIYTLVGVPVIGELGDSTIVERFEVCPVCDRRKRPFVKTMDYCFDRWAGEDLVTSMGCYAVSERLRNALEHADISGLDFKEMIVSQGDYFEITDDTYAKNLPKFYRLIINGAASGPELWWTSWTCTNCQIKHWDITKVGIKAQNAVITDEVGTPIEVFKDSWKGHDVFHLEDPGLPVVTQKFVDLIKQQGSIGVVFHPAKWVERLAVEK